MKAWCAAFVVACGITLIYVALSALTYYPTVE